MVRVITAARNELRASMRITWVWLAALFAALFPVIVYLLNLVFTTVTGGEASTAVPYESALMMSFPVAAISSAGFSLFMANAADRHQVTQSYVITGFPRDLLLLGRIAAGCVVTLAITTTSVVLALVLHALTWRDAPQRAVEPSPLIDDLQLMVVTGDVAIVLGLALLASIGISSLASLMRSTNGTGTFLIAYTFLEVAAVGIVENRWIEDALIVPSSDAFSVAVDPPEPWWSIVSALQRILESPQHGDTTSAWTLLVVWCVGLTLAAGWRLMRRDT